jgi:hypothetical protein
LYKLDFRLIDHGFGEESAKGLTQQKPERADQSAEVGACHGKDGIVVPEPEIVTVVARLRRPRTGSTADMRHSPSAPFLDSKSRTLKFFTDDPQARGQGA